jgi:hypothetical protein
MLPESSEYVIAGDAVTASVADAVPNVAIAPLAELASTVTFAGQVIAGAVVSWTVTVNWQLELLFAASFAETETVVVPIAKGEPEDCEYVTVGDAVTASIAVAAANVTLAPFDELASAVTFAGQERVGAVVSRTVTVN